jgi:hypothetical protein
MANVGYLEGTDPQVLTRLAVRGIGTVPISNGFDGHGKYINHLVPGDHIAVVVGYLHKLLPTPERVMTAKDLLFSCMTHNIPVLLIAPKADHVAAKKALGDAGQYVQLADPADVYEAIMKQVS